MFTNKYPYTDFHELNADWLLKNVAPLPKEFNDLKSAVKTELDNKVDKIPGKGLSTNDFTDADKTKLDGIEAGAQVNVQSDWDEDDASSDAYILNKPYVPAPIIDTASGSVASFPDGADRVPVESLTAEINAVQSGSGDPSPTNVRPISGWDAVNVTDCGKNLANFVDGHGISSSGHPTTQAGRIATLEPIYIKEGQSYKFVALGASNPKGLYAVWNGDTLVRRIANVYSGETLDTSGGTHFYMCAYADVTVESAQAMVILSTETDLTYEPYTGTTKTISLGSTIYGGTLDVTSGVLTIDKTIVDLGDLDWSYASSPQYFTVNKSTFGMLADNDASLMCDCYKVVSSPSADANGEIWDTTAALRCMDLNYSDVATFKTAVTGHKVVFELATPTTVQLTPTQVEVLLGSNNIWADSGDVSVTYIADTKLYIDKVLGG